MVQTDKASFGLLHEIQEKEIRPWIDLIDELRAQGIHHDVPLPQIAVMGDQSSGKSSVLEAISGVQFPRGSGLTTRCPTQLIMKSTPPGTPWGATAMISGRSQQPRGAGPLKSSKEIAEAIKELTEVLTDSSPAAFSTETITIEIRAPDVPDLTLIDLPGIVRTATAGQSGAVVQQVNSLIDSFLKQDRTIILAVIPANQDIATVDILERARAVDPEGDRTVGVITKSDLVGAGNEGEVVAVVKNVRKPLRLGYVMVKNRSQQDVDNGVSNAEALELEAEFFRSHPHFSDIDRSLQGTKCLIPKLSKLLVNRIKLALPAIKWELEVQLAGTQRDLLPLGLLAPTSRPAAERLLVRIAADYCRLLRQSARGAYRDAFLAEAPSLRLHLAIRQVFKQLQRDIAFTEPGFDKPDFTKELEEEMLLMQGRELPGFPNTQVFYSFMVRNVLSWRPAVDRACLRAFQATSTVTALLMEKLVPQFPKLCEVVSKIADEEITKLTEEIHQEVDVLFLKESEPFTTNESMLDLINKIRFQKFDQALQAAISSLGPGDKSAEQMSAAVLLSLGRWYLDAHGVGSKGSISDMAILLQAYWNISTRRMIDNMCLVLEQTFIAKLLTRLESECFLISTRVSNIQDLFHEDQVLAKKRQLLSEKKARVQKALAFVSKMAPECVAQKPLPKKKTSPSSKPKTAAQGQISAPDGHSGPQFANPDKFPEQTPTPAPTRPVAPASSPRQAEMDRSVGVVESKQSQPIQETYAPPARVPVAPPAPVHLPASAPAPAPTAASAYRPPPPAAAKRATTKSMNRKVGLFDDDPGADPFAALSNPAVVSGAVAVASNPAVQSAAKSAAQNPEVRSAALKALKAGAEQGKGFPSLF